MAFPIIESYSAYKDATAATVHSITMPSGITANDWVFGFFCWRGDFSYSIDPSIVESGWAHSHYHAFSSGDYLNINKFYGKVISSSDYLTITTPDISCIGSCMVFRISGAPCSSGSTPYLIGNTYYSISGFDFAIPTCPSSNDFVGGQKLFLTIVASDYMTNAAVAPSGWETAITVNASNTNEVMIAATSLPSFSSQVSGYKWSTGPVNVHHYSSIWRILEAPCPEEDPKDEGITLIIPTGHIGLA